MKHFLLVGASSAIAQETKQQLLNLGHNVTQLSRNSAFSDGLVSEEYIGVLPALSEKFDGLVYFPGTINLKPFRSLKIEDFKTDYNIHFLGAVNVLKTYHSQLNEGASVVLISSVAASTGMPFHASVASVKAAIEGLARSLAAEWAPKIRVNVIAPSLTLTPMAERFTNSQEKYDSSAQRHPLKRLGQPSDIAGAVTFLLSANSEWITGNTINVDGGIGCLR